MKKTERDYLMYLQSELTQSRTNLSNCYSTKMTVDERVAVEDLWQAMASATQEIERLNREIDLRHSLFNETK